MSESFTFFWSKESPFSQWHPAVFRVDGVAYCHAEQFMMAEKARLFGDTVTRDKILKETRPRECKALGREVKPFDEKKWRAAAQEIVFRGSMAKFTQNPALLEHLLATQGTTLVEASPYDPLWGIGLAANDPRARDRSRWLGSNWLGETLTRVRDILFRESEAAPNDGKIVRPAGIPILRGLTAPPRSAASR